jgi:Phospholipase_D-nuclease N-terminal
MLAFGVLFVLVTAGFWAYCLIDAIITPQDELRSLTTMRWALLIIVLPVIGAIAWLLAGRPDPSWRAAPMMPQRLAGTPRLGQQEAIRRHPAGRTPEPGSEGQQAEMWDYPAASACPPVGPDDDPVFMRELERRLRDWRETGDDY